MDGKKGKVKKETRALHPVEIAFVILAVLFVFASVGWFIYQNKQEAIVIATVYNDEKPIKEEIPEPDAPGILQGERININTARAIDLERLPQIGPSRAKAIVEYRTQFGPFKNIDEIVKVSGIGEKTYEKLMPYITIETSF